MLRQALEKQYKPSFEEINIQRKNHIDNTTAIATEGIIDDIKEKLQDTITGIKNRWTMTFTTQEKVLGRIDALKRRMTSKIKLKDGAPDISVGSNFISHMSLDGKLITGANDFNDELIRIEDACKLFESKHIPAVNKLLKYVTDVFMREAIIDHKQVMFTHIPESKDFYPKEFNSFLTIKRRDVNGLTRKNGAEINSSSLFLGDWFIGAAQGNYNTCNLILPAVCCDNKISKHINSNNVNIAPFTKKQVEMILNTLNTLTRTVISIRNHSNFSAEIDRLYLMTERYEKAFTDSFEYKTEHNGKEKTHRIEYWEDDAIKPFMVAMAAIDEVSTYDHIDGWSVGVTSTLMYLCEASVRLME